MMVSTEISTGRLVTAATFTAETIERPLSYWLAQFGWSWDLAFAPYNQIFQQLLDPTSIISQNRAGANLILLRFEDWLQQGEGTSAVADHSADELSADIVSEFTMGLTSAANRGNVPHVVCICPPSPQAASLYGTQLDAYTQMVKAAVDSLANGYLIEWQDVQTQLPVQTIHDPQGDKLGRIPYSEEFFIALAATIARKLFVIQLKPYKVVVLDCDNTLWGGVVGEDGPQGITISPAHLQFQEMLVQQFEAGMLLGLCSKNMESDVLAVFEQRPEMRLSLDHLVAWRVNWQPKSQNILALADELALGLDSFVFIDDNPVECAEVQANCPEVVTIQIPKNGDEIGPVIQNIWAFDQLSVTTEDKNRTQMYRENVARNRARSDAPTLSEFLASLDLQIACAPMRREQAPRISQLTQRTNQFNASTMRRNESELLAFCAEDGSECMAVEVTDRFGDYGLVGAILYTIATDVLTVDTFLLSCRVLGRGVEHGIIEQLAQIALDHNVDQVVIPYIETKRNEPVLNFLQQVGSEFKTETDDGAIYVLSVERAIACSSHLFQAKTAQSDPTEQNSESTHTKLAGKSAALTESDDIETDIAGAGQYSVPALISRIATQLQSVENIKLAMKSQLRSRPTVDEPYVSPQTALEKSIADIWAKALGIDKIGLNDKFTELGGGSLQIVQIHGQIESVTKRNISIMQLFTLPTVHAIAQYVNAQQNAEEKQTEIRGRAERQLAALKRHRLPRVAVR